MSFGQLRLRFEEFIQGHSKYVEKQKTQREGTMWDEAIPWDGEKEKEICAVAPPLEYFMSIPDNIKKQHFFQSISQNDHFIGEVAAVHETGLILKLVCMDGGMARDIESCKLLAAVSVRNIPSPHAHGNPLDGFQTNDKVRAFVIDKDGPTQRIWASLNPADLPSHLLDVQLGLISDDDLPAHFRAITEANNRSFEQCLTEMPQYNNTGGVMHVCEKLGIDLRQPVSLMHTINKLKIEPHQYADELRKKQMSKLALKHVTKGVEYFRAKKHTEAMQCFNFALTVDSNHVEGLVARGALYATLSSYKKAMEDLEKALEMDPTHKNATNYLSQVLVVYGRDLMKSENAWSKADAYFRRALKMNPWMEEAKEALYDLYKEEQKHKIASKGRGSDGKSEDIGGSSSEITRAQRLLLKLVNTDEEKTSRTSRRKAAGYDAWEESDDEDCVRQYDRRRKKRGSSLPRSPTTQEMYSPDSPTKDPEAKGPKGPKFDMYREFGPGEDEYNVQNRTNKRKSPPPAQQDAETKSQNDNLSAIDWLAPFRNNNDAEQSTKSSSTSTADDSRRDMRFISRPKAAGEPMKSVAPPPPPPTILQPPESAPPHLPPALPTSIPEPAPPSYPPTFLPTLRPVVPVVNTQLPPPMMFPPFGTVMPPTDLSMPPPIPTMQPMSSAPPPFMAPPPSIVSSAPEPIQNPLPLMQMNTEPSSSLLVQLKSDTPKPVKSHPFMRKTAPESSSLHSSTSSKVNLAAEATLNTADAMVKSAMSGGLTVSASGDGNRVIKFRPKETKRPEEVAGDPGKARFYRKRSRSPPTRRSIYDNALSERRDRSRDRRSSERSRDRRSRDRSRDRRSRDRSRETRSRERRQRDERRYEDEVDEFLKRIGPNDRRPRRSRSRSHSPGRSGRSGNRGQHRDSRRSTSSERRRRHFGRDSRRHRDDRSRETERSRDSRRGDRSNERERGRDDPRSRERDNDAPKVVGREKSALEISRIKKESKRDSGRRKLFLPSDVEYKEVGEEVRLGFDSHNEKKIPKLDVNRLNETIKGIEERRTRVDKVPEDYPYSTGYSDSRVKLLSQPTQRPPMRPGFSTRPIFPIQGPRMTRPIAPRMQRPTFAVRPQTKPEDVSSRPERESDEAIARSHNLLPAPAPTPVVTEVPTQPKPMPVVSKPPLFTAATDSKPNNGTEESAPQTSTEEPAAAGPKKKRPVRSLAEFDKFMKTLKGKKK